MVRPLIEIRWVTGGDEQTLQLTTIANALADQPSLTVERITEDDGRSKDAATIGLALTAAGTVLTTWSALVTTLQWWTSREPRYTVKLLVPGGEIEISNLSHDEAVALLAKHGETPPVRVQLGER